MRDLEGYSQAAEEEPFDADDFCPLAEDPSTRPYTSFNSCELAWRCVCALVFVSGALMMAMAAQQQAPSDKECAAQLSIWSPLLEAVDYEESNWASIFTTEEPGYTGPPTVEMENKWKNIIEVPSVLIPADRIPLLNRNIEQGFVSTASNSTSPQYIAGVEVFHHLHCLNVLRQFIWRDSYPEDMVPSLLKFNSPAVALVHTSHCIDTLRQALMCSADITPYLLYKAEPASGSKVAAKEDFQAFHKCRKFDDLLDWVKTNGIVVPWHEGNATT